MCRNMAVQLILKRCSLTKLLLSIQQTATYNTVAKLQQICSVDHLKATYITIHHSATLL